MSIPITEKAEQHSDQPHFAFTLTYSRVSGSSVVKIEVDVGKNVRHVGKIVIDVGIPPHLIKKYVNSLHRKGLRAPFKAFKTCQTLMAPPASAWRVFCERRNISVQISKRRPIHL